MIPARKHPLADAVLGRVITRGVRGTFHALRAGGLEHLAALDPARPVVGCCNHTNWWDGFALYVFARRRLRQRPFHLAMEEKNLRRYFFFSWLGVFGLDLDSKAGAVAGLRYAVRLLRERPDALAWIFVQGTLTPPGEPIVAKGGASFLSGQTNAQILPAVLRYEWLQESRPTIFVHFSAPLAAGTGAEEVAAAMNALAAIAPDAQAEAVIPPRLSLNKRWDLLLHRLGGKKSETFQRDNR